MDIDFLEDKLKEFNSELKINKIIFDDIIFEERVKINCFYCKKYNVNWTCPPKIPDIDYRKVIKEYRNIAIVSIGMNIDENNFNDIRNQSTNILHKSLLFLENILWDNNNSLAISFIGGSCKLCKNGCAEDKCRQPNLARIPIEATGINVVSTLKKIGIDVVFPIKYKLSRYGMILW